MTTTFGEAHAPVQIAGVVAKLEGGRWAAWDEAEPSFAADPGEKGGQVGQLVADLGSALTPKAFDTDWPRLDAAVWNQHPRMNQKGSYFVNPTAGDHFGGKWTRTLATNDFAGFRRYLVEFCTDSRPT